MWKPAEVVPQHKCRAVVLFSILILAIFGYAANLIYQAVESYKNPNTSFALSNDGYKYPDIYVCTYDFYGCDDESLLEDCTRSAQSTEGGNSTAVFNPFGDDRQELEVGVLHTGQRGWCVSFAASEIAISDGERDPEDYILLNMYWYPGGGANVSDTCIDENGEWESHSESVFIHFRDVDSNIPSAGIQVGYTCMTSASNSHIFNYVGIGLTKENHISRANTASYQAVATSSAIYKDKKNSNTTSIVSPYAWLSLEVAQETNSHEEITEINPLEIAEMFGNVGGFWDLLLLLWPIFFVTAARQDPHLRVRNFRKSATRGSERVASVSETLCIPLAARRRRNQARRAGQRTGGETGEQGPSWECADASFRDQQVRSSNEHGSPHLGAPKNASSRRNPSLPPISRAPASRLLLMPQLSRRRSSNGSVQEIGADNEQQRARTPPGQGVQTTITPSRVTRTASFSSTRDFIV